MAEAAARAEIARNADQAVIQQRMEANKAAMERRVGEHRNGTAKEASTLLSVANFITSSAKAVLSHAVRSSGTGEASGGPPRVQVSEEKNGPSVTGDQHANCPCEFCTEELSKRFGRTIAIFVRDRENDQVLVEKSLVDFEYGGTEEVKTCQA